jgi:hypothetical protein
MNKPQQKNRKKQLPHLVTIDDGLRLVSSSEDDDDDDEVQSLPRVSLSLSLSLSHTHTDQLRLALLLVHTQHDFVANQVSSLITAKISFLCHPLSSSVWDSGVWKSGEECGVWSAVE